MGQPTDGVALSTASRMLDEVIIPHTFTSGGVYERTDGLKLVVARENHCFLLNLAALVVAPLLILEVNEPSQEIEKAVSLQDIFPQIGRSISASSRIGRVSGATITAQVEGQKVRGCSR